RSGAMRTQLVRTAVLEIYEQVRRESARADQAMQRVLRREKSLRSVERRAVADAVYGLLRLQGRVDHLLERALATRKLRLSVLANLLKTTRDELRAVLEAEECRVQPTRWSPNALTFTGRTNVFALKAFKAGRFEVQDEGSQLVAEACGARPGQLVIDACAGAGGKALALAAHMTNRGKIIACDRDGRRLDEFRVRARRGGVHNWEARTVPEGPAGEPRLDDLRDKADVVRVDAPCSGLGALRRNPDARWRMDEAEVDSFPPRQREILARYARLVRPGGLLVYATWSLSRREDVDVRASFLSAH